MNAGGTAEIFALRVWRFQTRGAFFCYSYHDKVKIKVVKKGENDNLLKMAEKNAVDLIKKSSTNLSGKRFLLQQFLFPYPFPILPKILLCALRIYTNPIYYSISNAFCQAKKEINTRA